MVLPVENTYFVCWNYSWVLECLWHSWKCCFAEIVFSICLLSVQRKTVIVGRFITFPDTLLYCIIISVNLPADCWVFYINDLPFANNDSFLCFFPNPWVSDRCFWAACSGQDLQSSGHSVLSLMLNAVLPGFPRLGWCLPRFFWLVCFHPWFFLLLF